MELSTFLSKNGYNSVALDLRAHGESEGQFCTFGVKEIKDVKALMDYLIKNEDIEDIGIWGQSLGGAVALQALGYDNRIKFGIVESTFTDYKTIVNDYFHLNAGFSFAPFSNYLANRAASIAGFDPSDAKVVDRQVSVYTRVGARQDRPEVGTNIGTHVLRSFTSNHALRFDN